MLDTFSFMTKEAQKQQCDYCLEYANDLTFVESDESNVCDDCFCELELN